MWACGHVGIVRYSQWVVWQDMAHLAKPISQIHSLIVTVVPNPPLVHSGPGSNASALCLVAADAQRQA